MSLRIHLLIVLAAAALLYAATSRGAPVAAQDELALFKDNTCVQCHARENRSSMLSNKFLEWNVSMHKLAAVSCDKCHGGDPKQKDAVRSHQGMLAPTDVKSGVNPVNLPATCGSCHGEIASTFTMSKHFASVAKSGGGPSCNACHDHMSSQVLVSPDDGAALCATCHAAGKPTPAAARLDVPAKAKDVMAAIERASGMTAWAEGLVEIAKQKGLDTSVEAKQLKTAAEQLDEAKAAWHEFSLVGVTEKANLAFETAATAKDSLRKKLGST